MTGYLSGLFFISGFAALVYQVIWQRVLFTTFGVNADSVTVVVAVFMFGLGLGALLASRLERWIAPRALECFIAIELLIGAFGIVSAGVIQYANALNPSDSLFSLVMMSFAILAFPTILMGATLPVLSMYLNQHFQHVGKTIGRLYAFNTLGSALAALFTIEVLFVLTGKQGGLVFAVACNVLTALLVLRLRSGQKLKIKKIKKTTAPESILFKQATLLSGFIGFVALGLQMFWFRIILFMTEARAETFGLILFVFLCGLAGGARKAEQLSAEGKPLGLHILYSLLQLVLVSILGIWCVVGFAMVDQALGTLIAYAVVGLKANIMGGVFPALCHLGLDQKSQKNSPSIGAVGYIYFANIVGSTLGALLSGFLIFEYLTILQALGVYIIAAATLLLVATFALYRYIKIRWSYAVFFLSVLFSAALFIFRFDIWHPLQATKESGYFSRVIENRHGIITVEPQMGGDIIYGGGVYDGRFNTDPATNSNNIVRAYMLASLHPKPERVLEVGLSSGSWSWVLSRYASLQHLSIVEINSGYAEVVRHYPEIAGVLDNPKVSLIIDDVRRWLRKNPEATYDAIILNHTFYWRSNATNLLSIEFLRILKEHLNAGGVIYFNTTGALDSAYTAAYVFGYVVVYNNMIAASDTPFSMSPKERKQNLLQFMDENGKPIFSGSAQLNVLEELANIDLSDVRTEALSYKDLWLITDDNMATEYKKNSFMKPSDYWQLWNEW